ncbi:MAG: phosphoenolpyruvate--protein phosphotransferase [Phycisphaerales bacterium]|nr:phosphoenolpyruvate--protein phosphotransferase [Phycisphaerales bacterium]
MDQLKGIPVSEGVVIGRVFVLDDDRRRIPRHPIKAEGVERELGRLAEAIERSIADLNVVYAQAEQELGEETAKIFMVHRVMLSDPSLIEPMRRMIGEDLVTAEYAVHRTLSDFAAQLRRKADPIFATKQDDVLDLAKRVLDHLIGQQHTRLSEVMHGTVVISRDLTPSQTAQFDRERIVGFVTDFGGQTSHTAIVARALDLPAVVGCRNVTTMALDGDMVIVDADRGMVILDPTEAQIEEYAGYAEQNRTYRLSLGDLRDVESATRDGTHIALNGNIEFAEEVQSVLNAGGEGVGLFRTEFLYLTSPTEPTEEDHYRAYARCLELLDGKPLVIRTVDLGADKYTQERAENPERNPFLGVRSIRYCLKNVPMFKRQLRAILRASSLGPMKIMLPLITSVSEFRHTKFILHDVMEDLADEGVSYDPDIEVGMMVEVPSAALLADEFAREVAFFSIGTNDLVQYTLAVDRTNEGVADLYRATHPAVIRLIRDVIGAADRHGIPVSCCGEAAGELSYALLLVGLGLRTLSVTASSIPNLKRVIRSVSIEECEQIAEKALTLDSDVQVASFLRDRARKIVPEAFDGRSDD